MKLHNKKTGEITECCFVSQSIQAATVKLRLADQTKYLDPACDENDYILGIYNTLTELNEEWEDYKPAEPLIKDEKIRKAVRAWAEACDEKDNIVFTKSCEYSDYMFYTNGGGDLCFEKEIDLSVGSYTLAELCGEEE